MATGAIAGRRGFMGIAATSTGTAAEIGEVRNYRFNPTMRPIDATSFDSSGWDEIIPGQRSATFECEAIYLRADTEQVILRESLSSAATRYFTVRPTTAATTLFGFTGYVTGYEVSGETEGPALANFSVQMTGALTYTT